MARTAQAVSGLDLRVERVRHEKRGADVARGMGVSPQRIYQLEGMRRVPEHLVDRYMRALVASDGEPR